MLSRMVIGVHPIRILQAGLTLAWLMVCIPFALATLPSRACEPFRKLLWPLVRRGKLLRTDDPSFPKRSGVLNISVRQSFFAHFYLLGIIWNSILVFVSLGIAQECSHLATYEAVGDTTTELVSHETYLRNAWRLVFLLLLFEIHLARRLFECLFVSSFHPSARMGLLTYVNGLAYYVVVPLTLFLQSFRFDGSIRAFEHVLSQKLKGNLTSLSTFLPGFWQGLFYLKRLGWMPYFGAAVYFYGVIHQHSCHKILASLRPKDQQKKHALGTLKYGIPRGDWFELSSSAHYLAEIVIYIGLLLTSGGIHPAMWIMLFTVGANLYLLAVPTHEWYLSKFEDYPTFRRPLFPWIVN